MSSTSPLYHRTILDGLADGSQGVGLRRARAHQFRWYVPLLLVVLTVVPLILLSVALYESRIGAYLATDINHSGSLRFRSLYVYIRGREAVSPANLNNAADSEARSEFRDMQSVMADLQARHPVEAGPAVSAWRDFSAAVSRTGAVGWPATERMRLAANALTGALEAKAQKGYHLTAVYTELGFAVLGLSLPCSFFLIRALRRAETSNLDQTAALAQLSRRYEDLFENIPVACFAYDATGRIVDWNRAAEALFATAREEVIGTFLWEAISRPERWEAARDLVQNVLKGEPLVGLEWIHESVHSPEPRTIISNVFPLSDNTGAITGGICVNADVTARRKSEEEQQRLLTEVEESERRLSNITSRSHCLLWEATLSEIPAWPGYDGSYWNTEKRTVMSWDLSILHAEETERWLSVERKEGESFLDAWRNSIAPDIAEKMTANVMRALRRGDARYVQEFPCQLADGSVRWLLESVEITRKEDAGFELVGICTDITSQKEAETRLRTVADDLERSNRSLQEFAYIASHDLKEPLRKIRTFGGMLSRRAEGLLPPDCTDYLERMIGATERMQALIDGLLDYSRAARKPRAPRPIDLNETIRGVLSDLEASVERTGAQIQVAKLPRLHADPLQMRQLFQNLLSNAIKFHKPGQPPVIEVRCVPGTEQADAVRIEVADQGIGFDPKYAERIFDMFEQLDGARGELHGVDSGTGVGLAICRKIVERHGGVIEASRSRVGVGAVFTVVLPQQASVGADL